MSKFASSCASNGGLFGCDMSFLSTSYSDTKIGYCAKLSQSATYTVANSCDTGKGLYLDGSGGSHGYRMLVGSPEYETSWPNYAVYLCWDKSRPEQKGSDWYYGDCSTNGLVSGNFSISALNYKGYGALCGDPWS